MSWGQGSIFFFEIIIFATIHMYSYSKKGHFASYSPTQTLLNRSLKISIFTKNSWTKYSYSFIWISCRIYSNPSNQRDPHWGSLLFIVRVHCCSLLACAYCTCRIDENIVKYFLTQFSPKSDDRNEFLIKNKARMNS